MAGMAWFIEFLRGVDRLNAAELRQLEFRISIRYRQIQSMEATKPQCSCLPPDRAPFVPWELHDQNCIRYFAGLALEEDRERSKILASAIAEDK